MKRGFIFGILLAVVFVFLVLALGGESRAENDKCPDDKTCYWAEHKETHKRTCRHNENDGWQFVQPKERCGEKEKEQPAVTSKPAEPVTTEQPKNDPQPLESPTVGDNPLNDPEHNSDPVFAVENVQSMTAVPTCDLCALASTMAAAWATMASLQVTQAAP